ncbi:MAG TPA: hypothetical protein VH985_25420 [Candidatus Binatia bacterium]|jgi:hypothetical protein
MSVAFLLVVLALTTAQSNGCRSRRKISNGSHPEWDAFMDDFQQTVDKFKVPAGEQTESRANVENTSCNIAPLSVGTE